MINNWKKISLWKTIIQPTGTIRLLVFNATFKNFFSSWYWHWTRITLSAS
jgi:hypothetical protein